MCKWLESICCNQDWRFVIGTLEIWPTPAFIFTFSYDKNTANILSHRILLLTNSQQQSNLFKTENDQRLQFNWMFCYQTVLCPSVNSNGNSLKKSSNLFLKRLKFCIGRSASNDKGIRNWTIEGKILDIDAFSLGWKTEISSRSLFFIENEKFRCVFCDRNHVKKHDNEEIPSNFLFIPMIWNDKVPFETIREIYSKSGSVLVKLKATGEIFSFVFTSGNYHVVFYCNLVAT